MLTVVGSIARDDLEGPFGTAASVLGGSALYFSLAASLYVPVALHAPVGRQDVEAVKCVLEGRAVDATGLSVLDAPTFRWSARQASGGNVETGASESIYDQWRPLARLASDPDGWTFIGSMRPDRQLQAARHRARGRMLAVDTMLSYVSRLPDETSALLQLAAWLFVNVEELVALGGDPTRLDAFRRAHGLDGIVLKRGPAGSILACHDGWLMVGTPAAPVVDTTGAGDAYAGGFLGRWLELGGDLEADPRRLGRCLAAGAACAAAAISAIGLEGIRAATRPELDGAASALEGQVGSWVPFS